MTWGVRNFADFNLTPNPLSTGEGAFYPLKSSPLSFGEGSGVRSFLQSFVHPMTCESRHFFLNFLILKQQKVAENFQRLFVVLK